jgi:hypothetical protein
LHCPLPEVCDRLFVTIAWISYRSRAVILQGRHLHWFYQKQRTFSRERKNKFNATRHFHRVYSVQDSRHYSKKLVTIMGDAMDVDEDNIVMLQQHQSIPSQHHHNNRETANLRDEQASHGMSRRRSMSHEEERQRRASIKAILADNSITPQERRRSIQNLMDGRRSSIGTASVTSSAGNNDENSNPYGYGDANPYGYGDANLYGDNNSGPTSRGDDDGRFHSLHEDGPSTDEAYCVPICNENTKRAEMTRPPCTHYERKCTLVSHCCGAAFGCRICHDDSPILPPLLIAKQALGRYSRSSSLPGGYTCLDPQIPEDTHHAIDRFKVKEVICRECYTKQSAKTYVGISCNSGCLIPLHLLTPVLFFRHFVCL